MFPIQQQDGDRNAANAAVDDLTVHSIRGLLIHIRLAGINAEQAILGQHIQEPEPAEPPGKYPCPCCGYLPFPVPKEDALAYICPVCCWENDVFDPREDDPSDENRGMTLRQGRENYQKWGAVREDLVRHAWPPRPQERPKSGKIPS